MTNETTTEDFKKFDFKKRSRLASNVTKTIFLTSTRQKLFNVLRQRGNGKAPVSGFLVKIENKNLNFFASCPWPTMA
jgi:hypothetical protein